MTQPLFLNPAAEIGNFLNFLYRDSTGYVYIATKDINDNSWESSFFQWPGDANTIETIVEYVSEATKSLEVYIGPALYSEPKADKASVKGTNVLWTEFDGKLPTADNLAKVPAPTLRVQSSQPGHEHWYWALDNFETDVSVIERANRGLCYTLDADHSAWDATQILRPPTTKNYKRDKLVLVLSNTGESYGRDVFDLIPVPEYNVQTIELADVPQALDAIAVTHWKHEDFQFFKTPKVDQGSRSSAMMRLAFICAEMKMTDLQAFSILMNADDRWGKFKTRNDRVRRLSDLIFKARQKYPLYYDEAMPGDDFEVFGFNDFMATDHKVEWVVDGLLQKQGCLILTGPPGLGKTTISLQFAIHMALGKEFLGYQMPETKSIFFSMEMGHADLKFFLSQMASTLSDSEREKLQTNLLLIPLGYGVPLDKEEQQQRVSAIVERYEPEGIFIDSLGSTTDGELSEATVKSIMGYTERLRDKSGAFVWFIHHNRKAQSDNKRPDKLSDMYGSQYIAAKATTVLGTWGTGQDSITVTGLKVRLSKAPDPFVITRIPGMSFRRELIGAKMFERESKKLQTAMEDEDSDVPVPRQPNMDF